MARERHNDDITQETARLLRGHPALHEAAGSGCLDEEALAAVVSGSAEERHPEFLAHLAVCARCRHAVASLGRALADTRVAAQVHRVAGRSWRRPAAWAATVAAAAMIVLLLVRPWHGRESAGRPEYREPPITSVAAPTPLAPRGRVTAVSTLIWTHVPQAERYRVTLFDANGVVRWEGEVGDTVVALPPGVQLTRGASFFWSVEAKTGRKRWVASDLVGFSIERSVP